MGWKKQQQKRQQQQQKSTSKAMIVSDDCRKKLIRTKTGIINLELIQKVTVVWFY